jgi:hypothetical protein
MTMHGETEGAAPSFLTSAAEGPELYPSESILQYPLYRRLGGPQNQFGRYGEQKYLLTAGNRSVLS